MVPNMATPENIAEYEVNKLGQHDSEGNLSFRFNPVVVKDRVAQHYRRVFAHIAMTTAQSSGGSENLAFFQKFIADNDGYAAPLTTERRNARGALLCAGIRRDGSPCNAGIRATDEAAGVRYCQQHANQEPPPPDDDEIMLICAGRCGREISESYVAEYGPICPDCIAP